MNMYLMLLKSGDDYTIAGLATSLDDANAIVNEIGRATQDFESFVILGPLPFAAAGILEPVK